VPDVQRRGSDAAARPGLAAYRVDDLDGRLNLDDLDGPLHLDVIDAGADTPLLSERVRALLETTGTGPFLRGHRMAVIASLVATVLVVGVAAQWWVSRPVPLPDSPLILVKTSGADATQVSIDARTNDTVELALTVAVASVERDGVVVALRGITGPGLMPQPGDGSVIDTSVTDAVATVHAALDCTTPAAVDAAIRAEPPDFGVLVSRTAPEGETREDRIRLVGAQRLAQVVRGTCLQALSDRDLRITSLTATPLVGVAAADLGITVANDGTRTWAGTRISTRSSPWVANGRQPVELGAAASTTLKARLWLQDCASPTGVLADGIVLRTTFAPDDAEPGAADDDGNTFRLHLPVGALAAVARAFATVCSSAVPTAEVTRALIQAGGSASSAGTIEMIVRVHADRAALMEVDQGGATAGGSLSALESPVHLDHGSGTLHASWALPRCADLLAAGVPRFSVNLLALDASGGERRPYSMPIAGEALRVALARICGPAVSVLVS